MIIALQTTRSGSLSVPQKNLALVGGQPLFAWNLRYALAVPAIDRVFCVTDVPEVIERGEKLGCGIISLPDEIANGNHYGSIVYGLSHAEATLGTTAEIVVVLLGNAIGAIPEDLGAAVEKLLNSPKLDSICSVSRFNAFNPARAFHIEPTGLLEGMVPAVLPRFEEPKAATNEKNFLGDVYFFNGSFWICRREVLLANNGKLAFSWLGERVFPWIQRPFMEVDDHWQLEFLRRCLNPEK